MTIPVLSHCLGNWPFWFCEVYGSGFLLQGERGTWCILIIFHGHACGGFGVPPYWHLGYFPKWHEVGISLVFVG